VPPESDQPAPRISALGSRWSFAVAMTAGPLADPERWQKQHGCAVWPPKFRRRDHFSPDTRQRFGARFDGARNHASLPRDFASRYSHELFGGLSDGRCQRASITPGITPGIAPWTSPDLAHASFHPSALITSCEVVIYAKVGNIFSIAQL